MARFQTDQNMPCPRRYAHGGRKTGGESGAGHGVRSRWQRDGAHYRRGVDGQMSFDGGVINVSVRLGLLASVFRAGTAQ